MNKFILGLAVSLLISATAQAQTLATATPADVLQAKKVAAENKVNTKQAAVENKINAKKEAVENKLNAKKEATLSKIDKKIEQAKASGNSTENLEKKREEVINRVSAKEQELNRKAFIQREKMLQKTK